MDKVPADPYAEFLEEQRKRETKRSVHRAALKSSKTKFDTTQTNNSLETATASQASDIILQFPMTTKSTQTDNSPNTSVATQTSSQPPISEEIQLLKQQVEESQQVSNDFFKVRANCFCTWGLVENTY